MKKEEILKLLNGYEGAVFIIDARKVCMETLGKYFPNMPMLAALVRISKVMERDVFFKEMERSLRHKFARKPEVFEGNMQALYKAFEAVELVSRPAGRVSPMPSKDIEFRYTASLQSGQLAHAAGMHV